MPHLTEEQLANFDRDGFLVVENVLTDEDLQPLIAEYSEHLGKVAERMFEAGKISSTYEGLPFDERYTKILNEDITVFDQLEITLPLENVNFPSDATVYNGKEVFNLLTNPSLLDALESIMGGEIYSNPANHIRLKPTVKRVPDTIMGNSYVGATTWHQDMGALMDEALNTDVVTAWVAIVDAPIEKGCLLAYPGTHKKGQLTPHCTGIGIAAENYIPQALLEKTEPVPLPVKRGGVVFVHRYLEHSALPNISDELRWSFDLRYHPVGQPTGRPAFPGFVARSRKNPESLIDHVEWARRWKKRV